MLQWMFWSHTKQHSSKTNLNSNRPLKRFWSHTKQHSSKTNHLEARDEHMVLESYKTT